MTRYTRTFYMLIVSVLIAAGCTSIRTATSPVPDFMIGEFEDDYGIRYSINELVWTQFPRAVYNVVEWHVDDQFVITQNDSNNATEPDLFTRIDWIKLDAGGQFPWAFCYSVYNATSARAARRSDNADRSTPRTGCGGHPFSRMKRAD